MENSKLTIFTPVYNRADKIVNLYKSLVMQTITDFIWMIVDDGSSDNIDDIIESFIKESNLNIKYYKQKNQGKHVAHNFAVKHCNTDFFVCVDSDDTLLPYAVEDILKYIDVNRVNLNDNSICGILAYRGYSDKNKIGEYPNDLSPSSLNELYYYKGMSGDTLLVFKTNVIKEFPFPVFKNENFLRESISYDLIDISYKYLILNKILLICEYYDDGLTKNASKLEINSPLGAALFRYHEAKKSITKKSKIRNYIAYVFFSRLGHNIKECRNHLGLLFPIYYLLSFSGFIKYRKYLKGVKI